MARILGLTVSLLFTVSFLPAQSEEFGKWTSLFNGKDTTGWVKAKPGSNQPDAPWKVEDGALTNGRDGGMDLATAEQFTNYELEVEYKVPEGGNSGIYLRGQIEVQILDSFGVQAEKLGPGDVGAIYGAAVAKRNNQKAPGEWNLFRIRHIENRITVWHNGTLIQDNVFKDKETPGCMGNLKIDKGPIMFQGDHTRVWYRNIRIRPLCDTASKDSGWKALWNGKDLSEFTTRSDAKIESLWAVEENAFTNTKTYKNGGKDIWSKESFGNFLVHYEYRSDPTIEDGNSGFYLRDQWEIQILKESTEKNNSDGSLYSLVAPKVIARNPDPKEWNHMDVKVDGVKIWVWQNGILIHDGVVLATRTDDHGKPTPAFSKGPFKFQGDHGKVGFTNVFIKPLPDTK
jgi:hypothetical protein